MLTVEVFACHVVGVVVVGPVLLQGPFGRGSNGSESCRVMPLPILGPLVLGSRVQPLAKHQCLLDDLHLAEDVSLLLLKLLQGQRVATGLGRPQVGLLQDVDLQLLLST